MKAVGLPMMAPALRGHVRAVLCLIGAILMSAEPAASEGTKPPGASEVVSPVSSAGPGAKAPAPRTTAAPRTKPAELPPKPGDEMIDAYLRRQAERLDEQYLAGVNSAEDWQRLRPRLHREYLDMLGLWPLPQRTPLNAAVTGTLEREDFIVEKLHFQSMPRLYVTGNLYRPRKQDGRLPGVLYVCGHSNRQRDGNKSAYHHHGMWFATHGYVCLIIDSLQLGEIAAIHHGTYRYDRWWWHSRGYTPAGVECWNSMRAVDYLQGRPEVDAERIAVTGISGGGACSFWAAAADERIKVAVPVSGMGDLDVYVTDRIVNGHCDCMFLYNHHRWPWTYIAALVAPRALLFANSDKDTIFPMDGNERVIARLRKLYAMLGKPELVDAVVSQGGHGDRLDLRLAAYRWINRHLKNDAAEVTEPNQPRFEGRQLRVFPDDLPADQLNTKIDDLFVPVARPSIPKDKAGLDALRRDILADLSARCFGAWPKAAEGGSAAGTPTIAAAGGFLHTDGPIRCAYRRTGPAGEAPVWLVVLNEDEAAAAATVDRADPSVLALPDWAKWIVGDGPCALLAPRGVGPTAWTIKPPFRIRRSLALLGETVESGRVWDVIAFARAGGGAKWHAVGRGRAGVIAAYAALYEPSIAALTLVDPPASHQSGPHFLSVMRITDVPISLGLLAPRRLRVRTPDPGAFQATGELYAAAGAAKALTMEAAPATSAPGTSQPTAP